MRLAVALLLGFLFALGLALSGMTRPSKVLGFLDVTGNWNPSLALVMFGAIAVFAPPLDEAGNSVKAQKVIDYVAEKLDYNLYSPNSVRLK